MEFFEQIQNVILYNVLSVLDKNVQLIYNDGFTDVVIVHLYQPT